ncbi:MAG: putative DNA ligase [Patescibacteria group bacterium]|nr:MAG: putative DNA ligase [Patescibacteria group bacterium]
MKFEELAFFLEKLEKTSSRIEITKILADLFSYSNLSEIDKVCYLSLGLLRPKYESLVFNLAEKMVIESLALGFDKNRDEIISLFKNRGDLGDVAFLLSSTKKTRGDLPVDEVYKLLFELAKDEGEGSQERKIKKLADILVSLEPISAKFVVRIVLGKLRLGFSDKTILDALSWLEAKDKSLKPALEKAYGVLPDVGLLALQVKKFGVKKVVEDISPRVGVPVLPMLAQRLNDPKEMIKKMGKVAVEPKIDGLRIQIHLLKGKGGFVKAFTRNLNEVSWMFPELLKIGNFLDSKAVILDSEAVGIDEERKKLADFQTTMTRRRKHEIESHTSSVPIRFFVFDILLNGKENLMNKPFFERKEVLKKVAGDSKIIKVVDYKETEDPVEISRLFEQNIAAGFEGIMVKKMDSLYVPGRTGWRWVKMKQSEKKEGKLADTVDGVIMGYYVGKGKRTKFGIGGFLVGIVDKEKIKSLTKLGTGLTDDEFRLLKEKLLGLEVNEKPKEYEEVDKTLNPDFWVRPSLVVEIAADEVTKSPIHSSGYALRFPRLVRIREDKDAFSATNVSEIRSLFSLQESSS